MFKELINKIKNGKVEKKVPQEIKKEDETYDYLNNLLKPSDLIALKGSNGIKLFNIANHLN